MTDAVKQQKNSKEERVARLQPYQWKKGQSGNPNGRPSGKTLKEYAKEMLEKMTDEEREEFFNGMDKKVIWEMAEGKAPQTVDSNVKVELPTPLINPNVLQNDSAEETSETTEED